MRNPAGITATASVGVDDSNFSMLWPQKKPQAGGVFVTHLGFERCKYTAFLESAREKCIFFKKKRLRYGLIKADSLQKPCGHYCYRIRRSRWLRGCKGSKKINSAWSAYAFRGCESSRRPPFHIALPPVRQGGAARGRRCGNTRCAFPCFVPCP